MYPTATQTLKALERPIRISDLDVKPTISMTFEEWMKYCDSLGLEY